MRNEYDSPMVGWLMYLISVINSHDYIDGDIK